MGEDEQAFWMVWSPQGRAPTRKHDSYISAEQEAQRLALSNSGKQFYVLEAQARFEISHPVNKTVLFPVPF